MTRHATAIITALICVIVPFGDLSFIEKIVGVVSVYMCVKFFVEDAARIYRTKRLQLARRKRFDDMLLKATLPGKQHTLKRTA